MTTRIRCDGERVKPARETFHPQSPGRHGVIHSFRAMTGATAVVSTGLCRLNFSISEAA